MIYKNSPALLSLETLVATGRNLRLTMGLIPGSKPSILFFTATAHKYLI
jgi:hypothetical protein